MPASAMSCSAAEIFSSLKEAQVVIEVWRWHYNTIRPHGNRGYRPPAPETIVPPSWSLGSAPLATQLGGEAPRNISL